MATEITDRVYKQTLGSRITTDPTPSAGTLKWMVELWRIFGIYSE